MIRMMVILKMIVVLMMITVVILVVMLIRVVIFMVLTNFIMLTVLMVMVMMIMMMSVMMMMMSVMTLLMVMVMMIMLFWSRLHDSWAMVDCCLLIFLCPFRFVFCLFFAYFLLLHFAVSESWAKRTGPCLPWLSLVALAKHRKTNTHRKHTYHGMCPWYV